MLKTFLFDMGNVLVHFSHDRMCEQIGLLCAKTGPEIRSLLFGDNVQLDFERGKYTNAQFHELIELRVEAKLLREQLEHAASNIFTLNEPLLPVLDELKRRGHRLVVLSNTSQPHFEFVRANFPVLQKFDDYVLSYEVGAIKPEPAIFHAALEKIHCAPAECFYTDDIPQYIAAGRAHGLQAEVFTDVPNLLRQLAVHFPAEPLMLK